MKTLLLALSLVVSTVAARAQSIAWAKFSGHYIGIASPQRWLCDERAVLEFFVYPDGSVAFYAEEYDLIPGDPVFSQLDARGKFSLQTPTGFVVTASVSAAGMVRGVGVSGQCRYTFTALRKTKAAFDPSL